jgi:AcrR family transcriptional regulator
MPSAMPKISAAQRETRRQQILDAALRCFSRGGFHNTTTADIVRESGVSQGTLYLYFATKDDIIIALAEDRHQAAAVLNALAQNEQDPVRGLYLLLDLYGRLLADPDRIETRRVSVQGWAEALRNPPLQQNLKAHLVSVRQEIVRLIERGQLIGQFRPDIVPETVARSLTAIFQGLTLQMSWEEDIDTDSVGRLIRDMIRKAIFTEAALAAEP